MEGKKRPGKQTGRSRGARSKLTPDLILKAEELLKIGNYATTVCDILGIGQATWYEWIARGEEDPGTLFAEFADMVKRSSGRAEVRAVSGILVAGKQNWTALAWFLERRFPDKWGRRDRVVHAGDADAPIVIQTEWGGQASSEIPDDGDEDGEE